MGIVTVSVAGNVPQNGFIWIVLFSGSEWPRRKFSFSTTFSVKVL